MINISTPGRICLFGEHQDYLNLPVIAAAIDKRIFLSAEENDTKKFIINMPDINSWEVIDFSDQPKEKEYSLERDYFKSGYNNLLRLGFKFETGYTITIKGNIPINSGTSSSSALVNSWIKFLISVSSNKKREIYNNNHSIAVISNLSEVQEFGEPGGMMDHFSTAIGGLIKIDFEPETIVTPILKNIPGYFILSDSSEPKNTKYVLSNVKNKIFSAIKKIKLENKFFNIKTCKNIDNYISLLDEKEKKVLNGAIKNYNLTKEAFDFLSNKNFDEKTFGNLLNQEHKILDNDLKISTPKINIMINEALKAGALGGKINGSGGGGCMFVYTNNKPDKIIKAIENVGGKPHIIKIDTGIKYSKN